jgi:hypothetical protein
MTSCMTSSRVAAAVQVGASSPARATRRLQGHQFRLGRGGSAAATRRLGFGLVEQARAAAHTRFRQGQLDALGRALSPASAAAILRTCS